MRRGGGWFVVAALAVFVCHGVGWCQELSGLEGQTNIVLGSGARAFGMGGAFLARADDATAASWNPAGLSYLKRVELSLVAGHTSYHSKNVDTTGFVVDDDRASGGTPEFAGLALPLQIGNASGTVQLSFQRVLAFQDRSIFRLGRGDRREKRITQRFDGGFDVVTLATGISPSSKIRFGVALNRWMNGYRQISLREELLESSRQDQEFTLDGWNLHLGLIVTPIDGLNLGAVGKTPVRADVTLRIKRQDFRTTQQRPRLYDRFENKEDSDDVRLDFPGALGFGASWRLRSPLTLSVDYTRTFWSKSRIYNFFSVPPVGPVEPIPVSSYPTLQPRQADTEQMRAGVEYVIVGSRIKWPVRAGYFNDRQYFRGAKDHLPRFNGVTFGGGVGVGPMLLDAAYVHEFGDYLEKANEDRVSVRSSRFYVSLIYRHGVQ